MAQFRARDNLGRVLTILAIALFSWQSMLTGAHPIASNLALIQVSRVSPLPIATPKYLHFRWATSDSGPLAGPFKRTSSPELVDAGEGGGSALDGGVLGKRDLASWDWLRPSLLYDGRMPKRAADGGVSALDGGVLGKRDYMLASGSKLSSTGNQHVNSLPRLYDWRWAPVEAYEFGRDAL